MAGGHSAKRMTRKLPMDVFFNIVDRSALNVMNIKLKFQTTLQFKNRTRHSYTLLITFAKSFAGTHLMATHPF